MLFVASIAALTVLPEIEEKRRRTHQRIVESYESVLEKLSDSINVLDCLWSLETDEYPVTSKKEYLHKLQSALLTEICKIIATYNGKDHQDYNANIMHKIPISDYKQDDKLKFFTRSRWPKKI